MPDIIITFRIQFDNKDKIFKQKFSELLINKNEHSLFIIYSNELFSNLLSNDHLATKGSISKVITTSKDIDPLENLHHPIMLQNGWNLNDYLIKNKSTFYVWLENQWIKGKAIIEGKDASLLVEPENILIPISNSLFMKWAI
jgi:hypothetical protein